MVYFDEKGVGWLIPPQLQGDPDSQKWREFREYDEKHPEIWAEFEKRSLEAASRGFRKIGAHLIVQVMRWETKIGDKEGNFRLKNDYFPYFARKFLSKHPNLEGFFELRTLKRT